MSEQPPSTFKYLPKRQTQSVLVKVLMIGILILLLLIPMSMIQGIITERQGTKEQVVSEISNTWAGEQTLSGPILVVPYKTTVLVDGGQKQVTSRNLSYLLPKQYRLKAVLKPEARYRGIYQSIVYNSKIHAQGSFDLAAIRELGIAKENILWHEAYVAIGILNTKGLEQQPELTWQGKALELLPGVNEGPFLPAGLSASVPVDPEKGSIPFNLDLSLKGSQSLRVLPIGKENTLQIQSNWTSPSFVGSTLPSTRQVNDKGFDATWQLPYFSRNYGQAFVAAPDTQQRLSDSAVGVQLLTPVDAYRQSERAVKYGILFLTLTFATYFLFEIISRQRLHPFQYLLVGLSLSLFYLLLIALSEVVAFGWSYGVASLATISVITLYSKAILGKIRRYGQYIIGGLLSLLYTYLYVLLQLEDLSLLFGAIGLFLVLAVIMYVTRNIDWYNEQVT